jgi:hypothetical protein
VLEAAIKHANIVLEHITILLNYKPPVEVQEEV